MRDSVVGFMPPRFSVLEGFTGDAALDALAAAFASVGEHPVALAWSDELLAVFCAA